MDIAGLPYFMLNQEWFTVTDVMSDGFPEGDRGYHLTDKAPQEAVDSYNEFYAQLESSAISTANGKATHNARQIG